MTINSETIDSLLTPDKLQEIFPKERSNEFFDALFGDASEGAYDIELGYAGSNGASIQLELRLHERPGCCLACNLTQGLPQVFSRHPIINLSGIVKEIDKMLEGQATCKDWKLGYTEQRSKAIHVIPMTISLA